MDVANDTIYLTQEDMATMRQHYTISITTQAHILSFHLRVVPEGKRKEDEER